MTSLQHTNLRIVAFIVAVVLGTSLVIVVAQWITGSWSAGATAAVIAGVLLRASGQFVEVPLAVPAGQMHAERVIRP